VKFSNIICNIQQYSSNKTDTQCVSKWSLFTYFGEIGQ